MQIITALNLWMCQTWGDGKNMPRTLRHSGYIISKPFLSLWLCIPYSEYNDCLVEIWMDLL